jgi:hypothetical protein
MTTLFKNAIDQATKAANTAIWNKFSSLLSQLSPENLSCDGELTRAQITFRKQVIKKEWEYLELALGHKVTEEQVYQRRNA